MTIYVDESRILIIDSYDSFTNNLAALTQKAIPEAIIYIIKNDELWTEHIAQFLSYFAAIVVGPGPGSPLEASDTGIINDLWDIADTQHVPILGVCLGMQCFAVKYGASVHRLNVVKHGQTSRLTHYADDLFEGIHQGCEVVRYHSLCVDIRHTPDLVGLAWADDGAENGLVPMAIRHRSKPFWAVQYHPESICTDGSGLKLLQNFWRSASQWRSKRSIVCDRWNGHADTHFSSKKWPPNDAVLPSHELSPRLNVTYTSVSCSHLTVQRICETMGVHDTKSDFVLLDSAAHPGRYSIVGCLHSTSLKIQYFVGSSTVTLIRGDHRSVIGLGSHDVWTWLAQFMGTRMATGGDTSIPFWGGLIGYLSYELGVDTLQSKHHFRNNARRTLPDVNLVMVERSIVIDTETSHATVQTILPNDEEWVNSTATRLTRWRGSGASPSNKCIPRAKPTLIIPDKKSYISKIKRAQSFLFAGESYELCLTAQTQLLFPQTDGPFQHSWELYKSVRTANPAPFAAYLSIHPATLISSSPERFLSYSRPPSQRFQLRPIKGTVKKEVCPTREEAEVLLGSAKEVGENLMIVDLIRHDLHGVVGQNVAVNQFCGVEGYKTVWQLVSVIEGHAPDADRLHNPQLGWEVLRHSLPPGSMTGAPKKRSVELLNSLEDTNRGIYSGVVGYWCVGGGGDWSVVIRSCFKMDGQEGAQHGVSEDLGHGSSERWHLGAGGAITALSDPEAEWDEMLTKLQSVTRAFTTTAGG